MSLCAQVRVITAAGISLHLHSCCSDLLCDAVWQLRTFLCSHHRQGMCNMGYVACCRGPPMQSLDSHDEEEQALLDELLMNPLIASPAVPPTPSASATPEHTPSLRPSSNNTALGVVGMLRRLKLWTHEDARSGKLTILPRSIAEWLRSTNRCGI